MANADDNIDYGLYSRQFYVLGKDAMLKMGNTSVLVCGIDGLGLEIAKNLILGGFKSVTIHDNQPLSIKDISSFYYCDGLNDVGKNRADIAYQPLTQLNHYVNVEKLNCELTTEILANYSIIVLVNKNNSEIESISQITRANNLKLILVNTYGLVGRIFCDFGDKFVSFDEFGNEPASFIVSSLLEDGTVSLMEGQRHNLETGNFIRLPILMSDGVTFGLSEPLEINVLNPFIFKLKELNSGINFVPGNAVQKIMPKSFRFKSYSESLCDPDIVMSNFSKFDSLPQMHLAFYIISIFYEKHGRLPSPYSKDDAQVFLDLANSVNSSSQTVVQKVDKINSELFLTFSYQCQGVLIPIHCLMGGIVAQEVIKASSQKYTPINQWLYYDALECIAGAKEYFESSTLLNFQLPQDQTQMYYGQICTFGNLFQQLLSKSSIFVVGAGAIGCELLKNLSKMGACTDDGQKNGLYYKELIDPSRIKVEEKQKPCSILTYPIETLFDGNLLDILGNEITNKRQSSLLLKSYPRKLVITDMDCIERSNLSRQFLFRQSDIGKLKSRTAADAVISMNKDINIHAESLRVCSSVESETVFNEKFFTGLTCVMNALDNVEARAYVDRKCVYNETPLIDAGTLGTMGNVQVVVPRLTESYESSHDPPEKSIPLCTLKNFPYLIEHAIQFARDTFAGEFTNDQMKLNEFLSKLYDFATTHFNIDLKQLRVKDQLEDWFKKLIKEMTCSMNQSQRIELFSCFKKVVVENKVICYQDCVLYARKLFESLFVNNIKQLLHTFPANHVTSTGQLFWLAPKRLPKYLIFDPSNPVHIDFVHSAANLHAQNYGIPCNPSRENVYEILNNIHIETFVPSSSVKIATTDEEEQKLMESNDDLDFGHSDSTDKFVSCLSIRLAELFCVNQQLAHVEFEKDDDSNQHMQFVTACSNLRAENYSIEAADIHKTKLIAGKIVPAIATTTAVVAGLACIELYKILLGCSKIDFYQNSYVNLGTSLLTGTEPFPPKKYKFMNGDCDLWDKVEIKGYTFVDGVKCHTRVSSLIEYLMSAYNLAEVSMISQGSTILYSEFNASSRNRRLQMSIPEIVKEITGNEIAPHVESVQLDILAMDMEDEDVEFPPLKLLV